MKKRALLLVIALLCVVSFTFAQDIFNPADVVNDYPSSGTPAQPAAGQIGKWYRTPRLSWNTTQFKNYIYNGMAFRLRYPNNYNKADLTKKYPVILFFHGGGEVAPITDNENQLYWGAKDFEDSINAGLFNAFLLFPQVNTLSWDYNYFEKVNTVLDTLKKYNNLDEDKVISMGLSNGGFASLYYSIEFPRRSATAIGSSPALLATFSDASKQYFTHIPLFLASGALDVNPNPTDVGNFVNAFAAQGGDVRWLLYPNVEHFTWQAQWASGYLVNYWKNAHKANPLIFFQKSIFCADSTVSARIGITSGYPQYQWQKDLVDIPGATTNEIVVSTFGSYRVRFRRIVNGDWSEWSPKPAVIAPRPAVATPDITITGLKSKVLPASDGSNTVPLSVPAGYNAYEWRRVSDNALVSSTNTFNAVAGVYKALIVGCSRTFSANFTVVNANATPKPDAAITLAANRLSATQINLSWDLARVTLSNPTAYEVYRSTTAGGPLTLLAVLPSTIKTYSDQNGVTATTEYFYKVRAVNETAAAPLSNEANTMESIAPSTPASLSVVNIGKTFVTLDWANSTDNIGVTGYDVFVDGVKQYSTVESAITADNLLPNRQYSITVKARDLSGNLSGASAAVTPTTATLANGLKYRYYQGTWDALPNFNSLTHIKAGTSAVPDITVRTAGVNDYFGFVWEGHVTIPTSGTYSFELSSDDGSKLYFASLYSPSAIPLVSNDFGHGDVPTVSNSITVAAGVYPIAITYYEAWGGEAMKLYWTKPNGVRELIPASAFIETAPVVDITAPSTPANMRVTYTGKNSVSLAWDNSTDNVGVTGYDFYINNVLKTTSLGTTITVDTLTAATQYKFKVQARDAAGNLSGFSSEAITTTTSASSGLTYKYYEGNWSALPNFNTLTPVRTGVSANVDISVRPVGRDDYFAFLWEGKITITASGTYTFELASDDGSKLYIGAPYSPSATPLIDNDFGHGDVPSKTANITLAAGVYPIAISYFEIWGGQSMNVYWRKPNGVRELIPNSAFIETVPVVDITAPSTPANMRVTYTGKNTVSLAWDNSTDNVGVSGYDFYINNVLKITSLGNSITVDTLTAATQYKFKVQARDAAGNLSGFSSEAITTTTSASSGLTYKYYEGNWSALPNFNTLTPVQTGVSANVDISVRPAGRDDYFAFLWEGKLTIPVSGTYTFELASDDGSKLYIGAPYSPSATPLIDNDFGHGDVPSKTANITLAAGVYPIAISYFEIWGGQSMNVYWRKPDGVRELIPNSAFIETAPVTDITAPTTPANFKTVYTGRTFMDLTWDNSTDAVGVTGYDVYVNASPTPVSTITNSVTISNLTPNTVYSLKVQAKDAANNLSGFSTISANSTASGLRYKYYEGDFNTLPNFNTLPLIKTGTTTNIDVTPRRVNDYYAFVWEGYIKIPNPGNYTFELASDDGSKFYFNTLYDPTATALVNNDGAHGDFPTVSGTRNITAGIYPVTITYFEKWGGENILLYWSGPGFTRQLVPTAAYTENFNVVLNSVFGGTGVSGISVADANTRESARAAQDALKVKVFPNPFVNNVQLQVNNPAAGNHVTAVLSDITGRIIMTRDFGGLPAGNNQLTINSGSKLKPGIYMIRLNINGVPSGIWKLVKEKN